MMTPRKICPDQRKKQIETGSHIMKYYIFFGDKTESKIEKPDIWYYYFHFEWYFKQNVILETIKTGRKEKS